MYCTVRLDVLAVQPAQRGSQLYPPVGLGSMSTGTFVLYCRT